MGGEELRTSLSRLALFADLNRPTLEAITHAYREEVYGSGHRVLRHGLTGGGLHVILDGEAVVELDGNEIARLGRGEFFGEISVLNGEAPSADVRAETDLRCFVIPAEELEPFLLAHPAVTLRMLRAEASRLRAANRWE